MQTLPFLSIIVPTHNRQRALMKLLNYLELQDYPKSRFEIIIVDDGSTDQTQQLLKPWTETARISLLSQARSGPGAARNLGAGAARGEILVFTDSDCLPTPAWLSALAAEYLDKPFTVAVGGPIKNVEDGSILRQFQARRGCDHIANHQGSPRYLDTANASFLKHTFFAVGGFNSDYAWSEDVDLGLRLQRAGYQLKTTPQAIVWHEGVTSIAAYLRRNYRIGYAKSALAFDFPDVFFPLPSPGRRLAMRIWLNNLVSFPNKLEKPTNPLRNVPFKFLYNLVQFLTWEKAFWCDFLPAQARLFHSQHIRLAVIILYLFIEWCCHLAHATGVVAYSTMWMINKAKPGNL